MRKLLLSLAIGVCTFAMSIVASASQWHLDNTGWWYQDAKGGYLNDGWHWVNGKCYYFTKEGYCLQNTATPDGYVVNADGAWVVNGSVQSILNESEIQSMVGLANQVYRTKETLETNGAFNININVGDLKPADKASILYWYQYHYGRLDARISTVQIREGSYYRSYHEAKIDDLQDMMIEILDDDTASAITAFTNSFGTKKVNSTTYRMECTGDFGDAGEFYLSAENVVCIKGDFEMTLIGNVVQYDSNAGAYVPVKSYTAKFEASAGSNLAGYAFRQLVIE